VGKLAKYRRKHRTRVTAVRLDLDTRGFTYEKWGGEQRCKKGDWIVDNAGDTYTVDARTFARTYRETGPGVYEKVAAVWAERARTSGRIATKEGSTGYEAGDWLVFNSRSRRDGYAMPAAKFASLYVRDDS
jgi:hypothetical protein